MATPQRHDDEIAMPERIGTICGARGMDTTFKTVLTQFSIVASARRDFFEPGRSTVVGEIRKTATCWHNGAVEAKKG